MQLVVICDMQLLSWEFSKIYQNSKLHLPFHICSVLMFSVKLLQQIHFSRNDLKLILLKTQTPLSLGEGERFKQEHKKFPRTLITYMFDNYVTQKSSCLKIIFLWFNLTSFLLFHIKNTLSCSFKYYKNSDVIAVKKKS